MDEKQIASVFGFDWKDGSDDAYAELGSGGAIVTDRFADDHDLGMGDRFEVTALKGDKLDLSVAGISKPDSFNPLGIGEVTIARSRVRRVVHRRARALRVRRRRTARRGRALEKALASFPDVKLQSKSEFQTDQSAWVDQILGIFYVLLGLAVIVSLFGIVNTLALSVLERTRELGMLRAIGMSRRQVRRMIRHESVVTALIGAVLGIAVGLFLAGLATTALSERGAALRGPGRLARGVSPVVAAIGPAWWPRVLAAIGPARRASRLNGLRAGVARTAWSPHEVVVRRQSAGMAPQRFAEQAAAARGSARRPAIGSHGAPQAARARRRDGARTGATEAPRSDQSRRARVAAARCRPSRRRSPHPAGSSKPAATSARISSIASVAGER